MSDAKLMLHCGSREVTREQLDAVPCPPAEGTWRPVPHGTVLTYATQALTDAGYEIEKLQLGLSRSDARFFGALTLKSPVATGVSLAVGLRSSLDKSISLQWCCGARVMVCDNLAFRSEQVIARKHTKNGVLRYQEAICKAVSGLASYREQEGHCIRSMQQRIIDDHFAESFLLRAYQDEGLLSPRTLPIALKEWREPSFPDFEQEKNVWRLFNALTYSLSETVRSNPQRHAAATIRLGALLSPEEEVPTAA
jgi:hypothetical protein